MEKLSSPALLVAAIIWASIDALLKSISALNNIRDKVLCISNGGALTKRQMKILIYNDFLPLWLGISVCLLILTIGLAFLPHLLHISTDALEYPHLTFPALAIIPFAVFLGMAWGGLSDFIAMVGEAEKPSEDSALAYRPGALGQETDNPLPGD